MNLFANAAYGVIPNEDIQRRLEQEIEVLFDGQLPEEDLSWADCVEKAYKILGVQKILQELKMPSAHVILVDKTEDGCDLEEGTLIVGWGLLGFPDITLDDKFWKSKLAYPDMKWHLWVSA